MRKLCTIGYEGAEISEFLQTLQDARVDILVDVRELPLSRRKGFSKNALREHLANAGIRYRHERDLGSPREMRHRLRLDWDYDRFFEEYQGHLSAQKDVLNSLANELKGNVAFMCYERHAHDCHRSSVASALSDRLRKKPIHLIVRASDGQHVRNAADSRFSESLSTV